MANAQSIQLHPSGQEVGAGSGAGVDIGATRTACVMTLVATEVTGDPLKVRVQTSPDNATGWRQVAAFTDMPSIEADVQTIYAIGCSRYVRVAWDLGTSATFEVSGKAHQLIATLSDLRQEAPPALLQGVPRAAMAYGLIVGSTDAEDALSRQHPPPLTEWSASVTCRVARIALYHCLKYRGFNPNAMDQETIREDMQDAVKWLERYGKNEVRSPDVQPPSNLVPKSSSGDPDNPDEYPPRFTTNWADF